MPPQQKIKPSRAAAAVRIVEKAEALRANLLRRKAQDRARKAAEAEKATK